MVELSTMPMEHNKNKIGVLSLLLSCFSLLFAILPPCMIAQKVKEIETTDRINNAAVSLEIEGVRLDFAHLNNPGSIVMPTELTEKATKIKNFRRLSVLLTAAMILFVVSALGTAVYSWSKEHDKEICIVSIITAVVALTWQYIGAGISAGMAIFIFIMFVAGFS